MSVTPLRNITFTIGSDLNTVTPTKAQFAGMQGDHNTTEIAFDVVELLAKNIDFVFRIEYLNECGDHTTTGIIAQQSGAVSFLLPKPWTAAGGLATVRLVASIMYANEEVQTSYTFDGRIYFEGVDSGQGEMNEALGEFMTAMLDGVTDSATAAASSATQAEAAKTVATEKATAANTSASNAATSATNADASATSARGCAADALGSKNTAVQYAGYAQDYATSAQSSAATATAAKNDAQTAKTGADAAKAGAETAQAGAVTAKTAAETALTGAQTAQAAAETAKTGAQAAQAAAEAAAAACEAVVEQASQLVTRYGVRFGGSANTGATVSRLYNAVGLVAGVGTDTTPATNNFDNIYPWSARRRCCGTFDAAGNFIINAYKGEPGYIEDGTNGEVWVEHSLFFYKHTYAEDAEEITISATQLAGFLPAPIFVNSDGTLRQKAYTAAYPLATVNGQATSRAGVFSDVCSLNTAMTAARTLGSNYTVTTTAEWYTECLYMWVEFATRNLQAVMNGASSMPYVATDTATVAESGANRIIVANAVAAKYVKGQTILIGTSLGSSNVANNRIVTAIEDYDAQNKAIVFDGSPVNVAIGNIFCASAWINGACNSVLTSSGSPVSNSDGKHNCVYRGKETPYGNAFEWISDVLFKREGVGTPEDPYKYDIYFLTDPTKYAAGAITADYKKLNFRLPGASGYVKKLGIDSRFPFARIPTEGGASTSTYYSDYYEAPAYAITAARVGGCWNRGASGGPCSWGWHYAPSASLVTYRARLSYHRT